ncbi:hypothetical protein [Mycobacterium talmoniae]|uniref:Uncharacterized protein n=1 Tax=Mycobacterium talmoniae TaxID=1858794 RepID=A0A1S1MGX2_9MYCO|nr:MULTISPECIES: hypothetical protein [Mycobacterium]OHU82492.1 hypothetical protein BKN37_26925 [Mycobacterium talmoniae]PQM49456.1 hypothetical protein C1Y40_00321 [Mycobacterium talmoniae]TDH48753.1 hypothetical protein E2F47_22550 [Mycobacterium eburneum]
MTNPPPPEPPPGGWPPPGDPDGRPPRPTGDAGTVVGHAVTGVFLYWVVNVAVWFIVLNFVSQVASTTVVGITNAVVLAGIAFGVGGALVAEGTPRAKGLGIGLMVGWALTSVLSVGICTGLNPAIYGGL